MQAPAAATSASDGQEGNHTPKASRRSPTIRFSDQSKPIMSVPAAVWPIGSTSLNAKINPEVRRSFLDKTGDEPPASTILDTFPERLVYDPPKLGHNLAIDTMHVPRYVASSAPMPSSPYSKRSEASSQEVRVHQNHVAPVQVEVHHVKPIMANPEQATLYSDETDEEDDNVPLASNRPAQTTQQTSLAVSPVVTPDEPLVNLVNRLKISGTSSGSANQTASTSSPVGTPISAGPLKGGLLSPTNYTKEIDSKRKQFSLPLGPPSPMTPETPDIDDLPLASIAPTNRGLLAEQEHMRLMMMGLSMGMGLGMSMSGNVPHGFSGYPMYPGMAPAPFGYPQAPPPGIYPYPVPSAFPESSHSSSGKSLKKKHKKDSRHRSSSKSSRSSSKGRSRSRRRDIEDGDDDDDGAPVRALDLDPRGRSATRKKHVETPTTTATNGIPTSALTTSEGCGDKSTLPPARVDEGPTRLSISPVLSSSSPRVRDDWQPNSPTREQLVKSRVVRGRLSPTKEAGDPLDKKNV